LYSYAETSIFAARRYAYAACVDCRRAVPVRPSRLWTVSKMSKTYSQTQTFLPSVMSTILHSTIPVYRYQTLWQYADGDPLKGSVKCRCGMKIEIFDEYLALSQIHMAVARSYYRTLHAPRYIRH